MNQDNTPPGLRKPWVWVQPKTTEELIQRLLEAREYNVPERERENLCSVAYETLRKIQDEPCWKTIPGNGFDNVMFCRKTKGHNGPCSPSI